MIALVNRATHKIMTCNVLFLFYLHNKFCIQVSIQENLDQENLNSSLCIHDARIFYEYTQVLTGDTTNKMTFLGGEEGEPLLCNPLN
jgi:hypothetical protein